MKGSAHLLFKEHLAFSGITAVGLFVIFLGVSVTGGCGTLPSGRGWGQDATLFPGWGRLAKAARDSALSPETWAPAAGALVLQIDDWDGDISKWAREHTPIFGSQADAEEASDSLRDMAGMAYFITAILTPSGEDPKQWAGAKSKGIACGLAALALTDGTAEFLKNATERTRPDLTDDESFPSGHASSASAFATLTNRNLHSLSISTTTRALLRVGSTSFAVGTAWARLEAGRHYPSDVLAGYALGHFLGALVNDAFLGLDQAEGTQLTIGPSREGWIVSIRFTY